MDINSSGQLKVKLGKEEYLVDAMGASYGMYIMDELAKGESPVFMLPPKLVADVIKRSVTYKGKFFSDDGFENHFQRRHKDIATLLQSILAFNFGEEEEDESPLDSDSLEKEGTSEE